MSVNGDIRREYRLGTDLWLWLDPSQACNIACALCYTRESHTRSFLDEGTLQHVISNLQSVPGLRVHEITFNWRGEPLMNKRFPELLQIVCDGFHGARVQFHTNAMLINRRVAERLIAVNREYFVYLSVDGGNRRTHDTNRGAGTFDKAVRGGHRLLDARDARYGVPNLSHDTACITPHITLYQLDFGEDETNYDETFLTLAARVDQWQRVDPIVHNGEDAAGVRRKGASPTEWWGVESPGMVPWGPCFWAGYTLSVAPDGNVSVCILNQRTRPDGILGNLLREDAAQVLARATAFRDTLVRDGRGQVAHCSRCRKIEGMPRPSREVNDLKRRFEINVKK